MAFVTEWPVHCCIHSLTLLQLLLPLPVLLLLLPYVLQSTAAAAAMRSLIPPWPLLQC